MLRPEFPACLLLKSSLVQIAAKYGLASPAHLQAPAVHQALFLAILGGIILRANCSRKYEAWGFEY